uniref:Uncharacterized protein n=1 Tax=Rhizophora mucronata TaxID=61149 RepID=A0A2P2NCU9_RHIMU
MAVTTFLLPSANLLYSHCLPFDDFHLTSFFLFFWFVY